MAGAPAPPPAGQPPAAGGTGPVPTQPAAGGAVPAAAQPPVAAQPPEAVQPPVAAAPPAAGPPYGAPVAPGYPYAPPPRRSPVVIIVVVVVAVLAALILFSIIVAAILYVWASDFIEASENAPFAVLSAEEEADGTWVVTVDSITNMVELEAFQFYLKDGGDVTRASGEIAIQRQGGELVGVESSDTWDEKHPGENETEPGRRAYDVEHETDTCEDDTESDGYFPVVFYDNDADDKLSNGDQFVVRGSDYDSRYGANSGWDFEIKYDPTGDIVGSKRLP